VDCCCSGGEGAVGGDDAAGWDWGSDDVGSGAGGTDVTAGGNGGGNDAGGSDLAVSVAPR
jgi:hypothetical protein